MTLEPLGRGGGGVETKAGMCGAVEVSASSCASLQKDWRFCSRVNICVTRLHRGQRGRYFLTMLSVAN